MFKKKKKRLPFLQKNAFSRETILGSGKQHCCILKKNTFILTRFLLRNITLFLKKTFYWTLVFWKSITFLEKHYLLFYYFIIIIFPWKKPPKNLLWKKIWTWILKRYNFKMFIIFISKNIWKNWPNNLAWSLKRLLYSIEKKYPPKISFIPEYVYHWKKRNFFREKCVYILEKFDTFSRNKTKYYILQKEHTLFLGE